MDMDNVGGVKTSHVSSFCCDFTMTEKNSMDTGGAGWYRKQFDVNDEDKDGGLNRTEFNK